MSEEQPRRLPYKRKLLELLPEVLPASPENALTGTELVAKLRQHGFSDGKDNSLHSWFSSFAQDPTTPIARVANGHGYFLRSQEMASAAPDVALDADDGRGRDIQLEEKFRALFLRWCENRSEHPVSLNHNESIKRTAGLNKWKFPDVIAVRWDVLHQESQDEFDENALDVMRGLGEPPFDLISSELKVEIRPSNLRHSFFQCLSNSRWANVAQLVVAAPISDQNVVEELARLGSAHDIDILSFGLSERFLRDLPTADKVRGMATNDVEKLLQAVTVTTIATSAPASPLDWEQLRDLQKQHFAINDILEWIARCLKDKRPYPFEVWFKTLKRKKH